MERHVPELYDLGEVIKNEAAPEVRCATLGCGLLVPRRPAATLDRRHHAMPACRTVQRKCVETRSGCSCWGSGDDETLWCMAVRSVGLRDLLEDWAVRVPSCCVIWWQRRQQMDSAARMLSDDGEPSWNECC